MSEWLHVYLTVRTTRDKKKKNSVYDTRNSFRSTYGNLMFIYNFYGYFNIGVMINTEEESEELKKIYDTSVLE